MSTKKSTAASRFAEIVDEPSVEYARPIAALATASPTVMPESADPPPTPVSDAVPRSRSRPTAPKEVVRSPSRAGKVGMQIYLDPEWHRKLKHYSADTRRSLDDFGNEAFADFMRKHKIA